MTKHTPGPWRTVNHSWSTTGIYADDSRVAKDWRIGEMSIEQEATEENQERLEEILAKNAALASAAPELLDALKRLVAHDKAADLRDGLEHCIELQQAEAAIAKAEGK